MTTTVGLAPNQKLVTHTARAFFRLGILVQDGNGRRYGLTARHILESEADERVYDAATARLVGRRVSLPRHGRSDPTFSETIGAFALETETAIDVAHPFSIGLDVLAPDDVIGRALIKVEESGRSIEGQAVGFGGSITLLLADRDEVIYREVLEVAFHEGERDPVAPGEAGSLIVDDANAAVGLLIAGTRQACYVAPLLPFLEEHSLRIISGFSSVNHYDGEGEGLDTEDVTEALASDYRTALAGADRIRSDLLSHGGVAHDPFEEPIPHYLLSMLDAA